MGADKNRKRVGEILDRAMEGEPELLDARHVEEMPPKVLGALGEELAARYLESRGHEIEELPLLRGGGRSRRVRPLI